MAKEFYFYTRKFTITEDGIITRCAYEDDRVWKGMTIHRHNKEVTMRPFIGSDGYAQIRLNCNGKSKLFRVHHIVYFIWILGIDKLDCDTSIGYNFDKKEFVQIDHIDGNKLNNNYKNLEIVSLQQNIHRAVVLGIHNSQVKSRYISVYYAGEKLITIHKLRNVAEWLRSIGYKSANGGTVCRCINGGKLWNGFEFKYESNDYQNQNWE